MVCAAGDGAADSLPPAPGHYGLPTRPGMASSSAFTIGRRPMEVELDGPGPYDYAIPQDVWRDGPSYSMPGRPEDRERFTPGPGA